MAQARRWVIRQATADATDIFDLKLHPRISGIGGARHDFLRRNVRRLIVAVEPCAGIGIADAGVVDRARGYDRGSNEQRANRFDRARQSHRQAK